MSARSTTGARNSIDYRKAQFKVVDGVDRAKAESAEIRRLKKRAPVLAQARVHPFRLVAAPFGRRQARLSFALSAL